MLINHIYHAIYAYDFTSSKKTEELFQLLITLARFLFIALFVVF